MPKNQDIAVRPSPSIELHRAGAVRTNNANVSGNGLAVFGTTILDVGDFEVLQSRYPESIIHDHGANSVIYPGFYDIHMHPTIGVIDSLSLDVSPNVVDSRETLAELLRSAGEELKPGEWVKAYGYDHLKSTNGEIIDRHFLDLVCPKNPVLVGHVANHWSVTNSLGLDAGGLDRSSPDPVGGELGRDASGELNGLLNEQSHFNFAWPFLADGPTVVPQPPLQERFDAFIKLQNEIHATGVTSCYDCWIDPGAMEMYEEVRRSGQLSLRVGLLFSYKFWDQLDALRFRSGFGSDHLYFGGIKVMTDGAVGSGACWVKKPYEDNPHDFGIQVLEPEELYEIIRPIHQAGVRLGIHANGDAAIEMTLDCLERLQNESPQPDVRHRIEHGSIVSEEIVKRMKSLGVGVAPFARYTSFHGEALVDLYGDRVNRMFAHRWFLDNGIPVGGSSDFPCSPYDPLAAIQSLVTRASESSGEVIGENQRVSVDEAFWIYTTGSAKVAGEDHYKGRLSPGYLADFVVLDQDPREVPVHTISDIGVASTWVGGAPVYSQV